MEGIREWDRAGKKARRLCCYVGDPDFKFGEITEPQRSLDKEPAPPRTHRVRSEKPGEIEMEGEERKNRRCWRKRKGEVTRRSLKQKEYG